MTLLTENETRKLESYLEAETDDSKKNEITNLYRQYKDFVENSAMNTLILPGYGLLNLAVL
jgi:hypothetical protein